jgi:hypothetical protein
MTQTEQPLVTLIRRVRRDGWTSCTSDVLVHFRELAIGSAPAKFAESFNLFAVAIPDAATFLFEAALFAFPTYYPPLAELLAYSVANDPNSERSDWIEYMTMSIADPERFESTVEFIIEQLRARGLRDS